jgi:hypothetical protein
LFLRLTPPVDPNGLGFGSEKASADEFWQGAVKGTAGVIAYTIDSRAHVAQARVPARRLPGCPRDIKPPSPPGQIGEPVGLARCR